MKIKISNIIIKAVSSISLLTALFLFSCTSNKKEEIQAVSNMQDLPSLHVKGLTTFISDSGYVKYQLKTPELKDFNKKENGYMEFPQGLHVISFTKDSTVQAEIKSNYAKNLKDKKLWELKFNVEAMNEKGEIFNTELLYWDQKQHRIYTDKFVKITTKTEIITGYGLESNEDFSRYSIKKIGGDIELNE